MRARRKPSSIWTLRKIGQRPQGYVYESPELVDGERALEISLHLSKNSKDRGQDGFAWRMRRRDARLLARRIVQCLEDTE